MENLDTRFYSERQKLNLALLKTEIEGAWQPSQTVDYGSIGGEYGVWFLPYAISHLSGPHVEVPAVLEEKMPFDSPAAVDAFFSRLNDYHVMIDGLLEKIEADRALGVVPPDFVLDNLANYLGAQIEGEPALHSIVSSVAKKLETVELDNEPALLARVVESVANSYYPATGKLLAKVRELRTEAVHTAGIHRLPEGDKLYRAMIQQMTDTNLDPKTIHQIGLDEVARIHTEMDSLLKRIGLNEGTVGERMKQMLNDPQYLYPNTDEGKARLLTDLRGYLQLADERLPQWFGVLPGEPVEIRAVPKNREASTSGAFYEAPAQDGSTPGTYWINLADVDSNPTYSLQTLTYHEANPGHHLQTVIGLSDDLPILTSVFYSNAAGEGWGLYAERLAADMGIYEDNPANDIGRLQAELHRAVRLVVDTGMHALGWSREQAIEYSLQTEGNHESEATSEIERYAVWPGQALGYKLGELKIVELREKAKSELGDNFDIRAFHDRLLEDGALPLNLMEEKINHWINSQKH